MKIFADVNIFVDVQRRRAYWDASYLILKTVIDGKNEGFISALTPVILYFLRLQIISEKQARIESLDAIQGFKIVDLTASMVQRTFGDDRLGFEDAIQGNPRKWRVENSWGAAVGHQGSIYMMDEWFDEYLYEVIVRKENNTGRDQVNGS